MTGDTIDLALARELLAARAEKAEIEEKLDEVNVRINELEKAVTQNLGYAGAPSAVLIFRKRRFTITPGVIVYAKKRTNVESDDVVRALRASRLGDLTSISYNANRLSAWVRERLGEKKKALPPKLDAVIEIDKRITVSVTSDAKESSKSKRAAEVADALTK